ncbi:LacI family transcriptional regulator [Motilibacter peucedani]|uniref:LacI family transcriptional regulator n=2 Tax=Motilibacter peucedani TaxID=598650 RepID=A0A420XUF7_9ACTN|nr:LacI family transcriptional regulator [Motilibacter peucedani]
MRDVAREAGVALRTVSRVVNGESNVNAEMAGRVHSTIARLGYRPDERARQLRRGSSQTIGAALRGTGGMWEHTAEHTARAAGFMTLAASTEDDPALYAQVIESLCQRRVDGLMVEPIGAATPYLVAEVEAGLPVVAVDRPLEDVPADSVVSDNAGGIRAAVEHLLARGHREIAYIGDSERIYTGRLRAEAFRSCLQEAGLAVEDASVTTGEAGPEMVADALDRMRRCSAPPTALVTGNNVISWQVLRQLGPAIGELAVFCFDSLENAELLAHPVSTVNQDLEGLGRTAVDLLLARLAEPERERQHIILPVSLSIRASSEVPPPPRARRRRAHKAQAPSS